MRHELRECVVCGEELSRLGRADARYCSARCRQQAFRERRSGRRTRAGRRLDPWHSPHVTLLGVLASLNEPHEHAGIALASIDAHMHRPALERRELLADAAALRKCGVALEERALVLLDVLDSLPIRSVHRD